MQEAEIQPDHREKYDLREIELVRVNGCVSRGWHSTQVVGFWSAIAGGGTAPEAESAIGTNRRRNQQLGGDAPLSTPNIERHKQSDHDGVAASYS